MVLYWYEFKKLLSNIAVWGFIAICILFNTFLIISNAGDKYADFVGITAKNTGYVLSQSFYENLSQFKVDSGQKEALERIKFDTNNIADVFDGYKTDEIGERYITATEVKGKFAETMRDKYHELQKVVDKKASRDESLTLYFASSTYSQHQKLFNDLMGWLLIEGILIAVILVFLSVGYEINNRTEDVVYSTKKGRNILRPKILTSILAGFGAYALLTLFTFLVYFSVNEYGGIWGSNISSLFNYRYDFIAGYRPFVTWHSFSVLTYLMASLAMSMGVILCFMFMAFGISVLVRNHYIGFLVFLASNVAIYTLPMQIPPALTAGGYARYYSMLTPVWLWLKHSIWFTDGDADILWPHFETLGFCVSLLVLIIFCMFTTFYFRKRDLT